MNLSPSPSSPTSPRWPEPPPPPRSPAATPWSSSPPPRATTSGRTSPSTAPSSSTPPTRTRSSPNSSARGCPSSPTAAPPARCPVTAWVDNDHEAAVLGILDHLADAGARRIGLLTGTTTDTYTRLSTTAYLHWCERVGQDPVYEAYPAHDPCAGAVAADRLLARPDRPDAVYGLFDPNGTDLLAAARRYGLRVPEDLLLVCCSESTVYADAPSRPSPRSRSSRAGSAPRSSSSSSTPSRGSTPDRPGRAGDTDRTHRPDLLAAPSAPHDGQPAAITRAGYGRTGSGRD